MKVVLYAFWRLGEGEGDVRYLRLDDVLADLLFLEGMGDEAEVRVKSARAGFARAAHRGILIEIAVIVSGREETWYFLNSAKGRAAVERLQQGDFEGLIHDIDDVVVGLEKERPNIFSLYEQNIGMITPMLADKLRRAERDYPDSSQRDAFDIAVTNNKRNWAYIQRILENWAKHGKDASSATRRPATGGTEPTGSDQHNDLSDFIIR